MADAKDQAEKKLKNLPIIYSAFQASQRILKSYDKEITPNFNSIFVLAPGETHLTKAIAWFLNPNETHCQKELFLTKFLAIFKIDRNDLGKCLSVEPEDIIGKVGRLDIHIQFKDYSIVIENKLWGKDDPKQLDKYVSWLGKRRESYSIIFLSMIGQSPVNCNKKVWDANSKTHLIGSYQEDIYEWLKECKQDCSSKKVVNFIDDILEWIEFKVKVRGGREIMSVEKIMKELITEDKYNFKMLWEITNIFNIDQYLISAVEDTKRQLKNNLKDKLADCYSLDVSEYGNFLKKNNNQGYMTICNENNAIFNYCFESFNWSDGVYVGISKDGSNSAFSNETEILRKLATTSFLGGKLIQESPDAWWVVRIQPKIMKNWSDGDYEFQMAWHIANPEKRRELIKSIIDTVLDLIKETESLVDSAKRLKL